MPTTIESPPDPAVPEGAATPMAKLLVLVASQGALGAAVLHAAGYLAMRHQLDVLGIETSLYIIDERYLFEGAQAIVHMLVALPQLVLALLLPAVLLAWVYRGSAALRRGIGRMRAASGTSGTWIVLPAIVFSASAVQFIMCRPFELSDLLLRTELPPTAWLRALVLDESGMLLTFYFGTIVVLTGISALLLKVAWQRHDGRLSSLFWQSLLIALVGAQVLLLPINYGILTAGQEVPRVRLGDAEAQSGLGIEAKAELWLLWETQAELYLLVRTRAKPLVGQPPGKGKRRLIVVDRKKAVWLETLCIDPLVRLLYRGAKSECDGG